MLLGLRSIIQPAPDLDAAKVFCTAMLGKDVFGLVENPVFAAEPPPATYDGPGR